MGVVDLAIQDAHIEDGDDRCGGEEAELRGGQRIIAANCGETDGDRSGKAQSLDDVFAKEGDGEGEGSSREHEERQREETACCTDQ